MSMLSRDDLLTLHNQAQHYAVADIGWRYLASVPLDPPIVTAVVDSMIQIGLAGPAKELIQTRRDLPESEQTTALLATIDQKPAGRVPRPQLQSTYARNIEALLECHPHMRDWQPQIEGSLGRVHFFQTQDGHYLLSTRQAGKPREWLPWITNYAGEIQPVIAPFTEASLVVQDGLSLGPLSDRLFAATDKVKINHSVPLLLIDFDLMRLAAWLHVADRTEMLQSPRVHVFCGPHALQTMATFLGRHEDISTTQTYVVTTPGCVSRKDDIKKTCEDIEVEHEKIYFELDGRLEPRYASMTRKDWQTRLQAPGGVVLGMTSRSTTVLQYSTRDIGDALESLGHEFHMLMEPSEHTQLTGLRVMREIERLDPTFLLMVDHLRYEYPGTLYNIPVLTWIQDPLPALLCDDAGASIGDYDFVCGYYGRQCTEDYGYPRSRFYDVSVPASSRVFHDQPLSTAEREAYECDIMYAGHLSKTAETWLEEWIAECQSHVHPLLHDLYNRVCELIEAGQHLPEDRDQMVRDACARMDALMPESEVTRIANYFVHRLFDIKFRHETLTWICQWAQAHGKHFKIYGNGWAEHSAFAPFAHAAVAHGAPLRAAYRGARLVLQTIPSGYRHQRTFEALLSGSLVVARFTPGDYDWLTDNEVAEKRERGDPFTGTLAVFQDYPEVMFRSPASFEQLADRLLTDDTHYERVRCSLQQAVKDNYTYEAMVPQILAAMTKSFAEPAGKGQS